MAKITVSFKLDDEQDQDLVNWLLELPQGSKSAVIREMLRVGLAGEQAEEGVTLDTLYQKLSDIEQKIKTGRIVAEKATYLDEDEEPPELAAALDALAGL